MLEASADDAEALEGLEALGAADAAELTASINRDIDVLTAPEERRKGVVRRLSYVRLTLAAAILISFGGGLWMLSQLQKQNSILKVCFFLLLLGTKEIFESTSIQTLFIVLKKCFLVFWYLNFNMAI